MRTAAVILAAGRGRRLGGLSKPLLRWQGRTLAGHALHAAVDSGASPVLVLGHREEQVREVLEAEEPELMGRTRLVVLPGEEPMAGSFRAGIERAAQTGADRVLLMLVDQPAIGSAALRRVLDAHQPGTITRGSISGRPGHPVLMCLGDAQRAAARAAGDEGARSYLRVHRGRTALVPLDGVAQDWDVDRPEDLARFDVRPHQ